MEYDLGSVQSLFGVISGQLQNISRDCSCSSTNDLCAENMGTQKHEYLAQKLLACLQLLEQCQMVLKISSVEIDKLKNTIISLQGERIAAATTTHYMHSNPSEKGRGIKLQQYAREGASCASCKSAVFKSHASQRESESSGSERDAVWGG